MVLDSFEHVLAPMRRVDLVGALRHVVVPFRSVRERPNGSCNPCALVEQGTRKGATEEARKTERGEGAGGERRHTVEGTETARFVSLPHASQTPAQLEDEWPPHANAEGEQEEGASGGLQTGTGKLKRAMHAERTIGTRVRL
jgi:hypothetical protein